MALDLLQPREPLQALLKRLQNDPFSVWPGRTLDDHHGDGPSPPEGGEEDDGSDPHRGSKRQRGRHGPYTPLGIWSELQPSVVLMEDFGLLSKNKI